MKDRFNFENESFEQCQKEEYNKYSVNIPMRYYYKGSLARGWVNYREPFRGTWVVGTPGSGKTFSIIELEVHPSAQCKRLCHGRLRLQVPNLGNQTVLPL